MNIFLACPAPHRQTGTRQAAGRKLRPVLRPRPLAPAPHALPNPGQVRPQVLMASSVDARLRAVERVLSVSIGKLQAGDFDI